MRGGPGTGRDRRGASEVLGAIFVFAIVIAAVGVFQVTIVPQTNEEIEFKHSTQVRADMGDLRSGMVSTGTDGGRRSVSVSTGVDYPSRSFAVNPPDPRGQLSTSAEIAGAVELTNVATTDPEAGDYWNGTATFDTRFVSYRPSYNYYGDAPTTRYEPTMVYSSFRDGDVVETAQSLVDGRTLNLVLVSGSLSQSGGATGTVDVVPVSTSSRTVTVTDPGPLLVKTHLSEPKWQALLSTEPNASVASYTTNADAPNVVEISLASGEWNLRASKVGLNTGGSTSAAYLTAEGPTSRTLNTGEDVDYAVRALDAYGNPVSGVTVRRDGGAASTTGEDGRVTFELAPTGNTTESVWIGSSKPASGGAPGRVDFELVFPPRGRAGNGVINPPKTLRLRSVQLDGDNDVVGRFENRASTSVNLTALRFAFYNPDTKSNSPVDVPEELDTNRTATTAVMGGDYVSTGGVTVSSGQRIGIKFDPISDDPDPDSDFDVDSADFMVVEFYFANGRSSTYFFGAEYETT